MGGGVSRPDMGDMNMTTQQTSEIMKTHDFCDHGLLDLTANQWKEFCRRVLVPMAEGDARSMNKALELLVRGNLGGYTLRMEKIQLKRTAEILADQMIADYDFLPENKSYYVDMLKAEYFGLMLTLLDKHAIIQHGISTRAGKLDLFTYKPVQQI